MTRPRPSRKARWVIGLSLMTIFALVTFSATMVALVQVTAALPDSTGYEGYQTDPGWADATARATILDVDVYDLDDVKQPLYFDRFEGSAGYAVVDIRFRNNGRSVEQTRISVASMNWPDDQDLPEIGDVVEIEYNSHDPEDGPEIAGTAAGNPESGIDPVLSSVPVVEPDSPSGVVTAPVRWTIAVGGLLTLLTLVGTVIWARRAEPAEGTGAPGGWNEPGWQQGRPAMNPMTYPQSAPGYPAQQYPGQQYPGQQYPGGPQPAQPTRPVEPPPFGLTPPG